METFRLQTPRRRHNITERSAAVPSAFTWRFRRGFRISMRRVCVCVFWNNTGARFTLVELYFIVRSGRHDGTRLEAVHSSPDHGYDVTDDRSVRSCRETAVDGLRSPDVIRPNQKQSPDDAIRVGVRCTLTRPPYGGTNNTPGVSRAYAACIIITILFRSSFLTIFYLFFFLFFT